MREGHIDSRDMRVNWWQFTFIASPQSNQDRSLIPHHLEYDIKTNSYWCIDLSTYPLWGHRQRPNTATHQWSNETWQQQNEINFIIAYANCLIAWFEPGRISRVCESKDIPREFWHFLSKQMGPFRRRICHSNFLAVFHHRRASSPRK